MIFKKIVNYVFAKVKEYDMYGKEINFTYKGDQTYNTFVGGLTSISIFVMSFIYAYLLFNIMISNSNSAKSTNKLVKNLGKNDTRLVLNETNFSIAFSLDDRGSNLLSDQSLLTIELLQYVWEKNSEGVYQVQTQEVPLVQGGEQYFNFDTEEVITNSIDRYLCPETNIFELQGNSISERYSYIEFNVKK